jgi:hypothetical protein
MPYVIGVMLKTMWKRENFSQRFLCDTLGIREEKKDSFDLWPTFTWLYDVVALSGSSAFKAFSILSNGRYNEDQLRGIFYSLIDKRNVPGQSTIEKLCGELLDINRDETSMDDMTWEDVKKVVGTPCGFKKYRCFAVPSIGGLRVLAEIINVRVILFSVHGKVSGNRIDVSGYTPGMFHCDTLWDPPLNARRRLAHAQETGRARLARRQQRALMEMRQEHKNGKKPAGLEHRDRTEQAARQEEEEEDEGLLQPWELHDPSFYQRDKDQPEMDIGILLRFGEDSFVVLWPKHSKRPTIPEAEWRAEYLRRDALEGSIIFPDHGALVRISDTEDEEDTGDEEKKKPTERKETIVKPTKGKETIDIDLKYPETGECTRRLVKKIRMLRRQDEQQR